MMNKLHQCVAVLFITSAILPACRKDKDDVKMAATATIQQPAGGFTTDRYKFLLLAGSSSLSNATYEWTVDGAKMPAGDTLRFISDTEGNYQIVLRATSGSDTASTTIQVSVKKESTAYSTKAIKVFEYFPAPGQFVNTMPAYETGQTETQILATVDKALKEDAGINLGGYGGYIVMGFDHAILNKTGKPNFRVLGNGFDQWSESGIIEVSMDANGNGLPDDAWYEIAGSEYNSPLTIHNYEITYQKPDENKVPMPNENDWSVSDTTYIRWTDNQGRSGYLSKNVFHTQPYYPQWKGSSIKFKGTLLTSSNIKDLSGDGSYYVSPPFSFGYADNWPDDDERAAIKLDWAVDKNGQRVSLPAINFVRVYTGIRAEAGWLGEISTEVFGVEDLNIKK